MKNNSWTYRTKEIDPKTVGQWLSAAFVSGHKLYIGHWVFLLLPQAPQRAPPGYYFWGYQQANVMFSLLEPNSPLAFSSRLPQPFASHWSPLTWEKKSVIITFIHCLESQVQHTILTAEAEQIVVHVISVTLKQLDSHVHHVLKGLHLGKKDSNSDTHSDL